MTALVVAIFLTSVSGSLHCAGMCGAFLAIAAGGMPGRGWRGQVALQGAYHVGRLITYVALGAAAGAAGQLLDLAGAMVGIRPVAAALAGLVMLGFGLVALLRSAGMRIGGGHTAMPWAGLMQRGHRAALRCPPLVRPLLIGLLTTLLPCGWLYAFAITAAGTGNAARGMLVMAVFWVGTLPMLVALGAGLRRVVGPIGRRLPIITAIALTATGAYTLIARAALDPAALARRLQAADTRSGSSPTVTLVGQAPCCEIHDR